MVLKKTIPLLNFRLQTTFSPQFMVLNKNHDQSVGFVWYCRRKQWNISTIFFSACYRQMIKAIESTNIENICSGTLIKSVFDKLINISNYSFVIWFQSTCFRLLSFCSFFIMIFFSTFCTFFLSVLKLHY